MGKIARSEEGMLSPILLDWPQEEVSSQEFPVGRELLAAIPLGSGNDCTSEEGNPHTDPPGFALRKKLHRKSFLLAPR